MAKLPSKYQLRLSKRESLLVVRGTFIYLIILHPLKILHAQLIESLNALKCPSDQHILSHLVHL